MFSVARQTGSELGSSSCQIIDEVLCCSVEQDYYDYGENTSFRLTKWFPIYIL